MTRTVLFAVATALIVAAIVTEISNRLFADRAFASFLVCAFAVLLASLATAAVANARRGLAPVSVTTDADAADAYPADSYKGTDPDAVRESGTVKWFNRNKGFGFIVRDSGGEIFVHQNSLDEADTRSLRDGERVSFVVTSHKKGLQADSVLRDSP